MDLRKEPRYAVDCSVETSGGSGFPEQVCVSGTLINISAGGACVLSDQSVSVFTLLPCHFHFALLPVGIPILTQVRWVEPLSSNPPTFRIGLEFVL